MRHALSKFVVTGVATLILLVVLFPIFWIISSSLRPYGSIFTTEFRLIPEGANLEAFKWVLFESKFWLYAKNSLVIYGVAVVASLLVTIPAAYGYSRFSFPGKSALLNSYFVLAQFMSGMSIIGLIGLYLFLVHIGLTDSKGIVGLIYAASTVPFVTWYLKTYFDTLPREYDEAAFLDGATFFQTICKVIIPNALPGLIVATIFVSIMVLSEWVIASILLSPDNFTLPVALVTLQGRWETPWNQFAAMALIYSVPLLLLFIFSHRSMEEGVSMAGLQG